MARDMVKYSLPIKCLEAAIIGIHLTNPCLDIDRFTISFKSQFHGEHVCLYMPMLSHTYIHTYLTRL